jgi:hypothetical protein
MTKLRHCVHDKIKFDGGVMVAQTTIKKSLYKNYCNDWIYLDSSDVMDFYFCEDKSQNDISLIVRLSSKPTDYFCMPASETKLALDSNLMEDNAIFAVCYRKYLNQKECKCLL